jgi:hypothetical protein
MYCPRCKTEYREGFTHCSDCDVDLVDTLPAAATATDVALVNVFETANPALIPVVRSLLDDAEIVFLTKNENLQDIFGGGRLAGFNNILGPVQFWVREDDATTAKALLADIEASAPQPLEE